MGEQRVDFMLMVEDIIPEYPVHVAMPTMAPHQDGLLSLHNLKSKYSFFLTLPLVMVFHHGNRKVTNTSTHLQRTCFHLEKGKEKMMTLLYQVMATFVWFCVDTSPHAPSGRQ